MAITRADEHERVLKRIKIKLGLIADPAISEDLSIRLWHEIEKNLEKGDVSANELMWLGVSFHNFLLIELALSKNADINDIHPENINIIWAIVFEAEQSNTKVI